MKGSFIAGVGAACANVGGDVEGGLYALGGAINFGSGTATKTTGCSVTGVPLPIALLSFEAQCKNENISLEWSSASEINNDYYTIERSIDGVNWQVISIVLGAGNTSNLMYYSFTDKSNNYEISYYRLKQTDFDGDFDYSNILEVKNCEKNVDFNVLEIYPNPANEFLNVSINFPEEEIISMSIQNLFGEIIYYKESYQSKIVFENKLSGIYILQIKCVKKTLFEKFIITS
jgi:hypothetical protein